MALWPEYLQYLSDTQQVIAVKLGSDIDHADKPTRVQNVATLVLLAVVLKTLEDETTATEASLFAALDGVASAEYADEPIEPPEPGA